jgi:hypothetical protein
VASKVGIDWQRQLAGSTMVAVKRRQFGTAAAVVRSRSIQLHFKARSSQRYLLRKGSRVVVMKKKIVETTTAAASVAESVAAPAAKKSRAKVSPKPAEEPPAAPPRKSTAELLREVLAAKNAGNASAGPRLRPQMGGGKVAKDAERRSGQSRKVH